MVFYYTTLALSNLLLIIAFIFGIRKHKLFQKEKKWFLYYLGFILGIEIIIKSCIFIFELSDINFLYPFYISGEFLILLMMFVFNLGINRKWLSIIYLIGGIIFIEGAYLWLHDHDVSDGYGKIVSHLLIICIVAYSLMKELKNIEIENKFTLIYACLLLYYSISLFLFLLLPQLNNLTSSSAYIIWSMNNILSSCLYAVSLYTFLLLKK